jgi:hypothetical protein
MAMQSVATIALALPLPALILVIARWRAGWRRRYVRLAVAPYRTDRGDSEVVVELFEVLHKRLLQRWWRRLLAGQPSVALEILGLRRRREVPNDRVAWRSLWEPGDQPPVVPTLGRLVRCRQPRSSAHANDWRPAARLRSAVE